MEALLKQHKAEVKALAVQATGMLNGKKGAERSAAELEVAKLKRELAERQMGEERALRAKLEEEAARQATRLTEAEEEEEGGDAGAGAEGAQAKAKAEDAGKAKAAKALERRRKKAAEERAKELEAEKARERVGTATPRDAEMETLQRALEKLGLRVQQVAPDGDCLFSSVRNQLEVLGKLDARAAAEEAAEGEEDLDAYGGGGGGGGAVRAEPVPSVQELRKRAARAMLENPAMFAPFLPEGETLDTYVKKVQRKAEWGGELELRALGLALRRPIWVHHARGPIVKMCEEEFGREAAPLHLTFHEHQFSLGEHYNSAIPAEAVPAGDGFVTKA